MIEMKISHPIKPQFSVLSVEDDLVDQMAIEQMFKENLSIQDYKIVDSVKRAISAIEVQKFDVVVSDFHLIDGTGMDILKQMSNKPVIILTGAGDESLAVKSMKAGAMDYLIKDSGNFYIKMLPTVIKNAFKKVFNGATISAYVVTAIMSLSNFISYPFENVTRF